MEVPADIRANLNVVIFYSEARGHTYMGANASSYTGDQTQANLPQLAKPATEGGTVEAFSSSQAYFGHLPYPPTDPPSTNATSVASLSKDSCQETRARATVSMSKRIGVCASGT